MTDLHVIHSNQLVAKSSLLLETTLDNGCKI